jgi:hypothetical protein
MQRKHRFYGAGLKKRFFVPTPQVRDDFHLRRRYKKGIYWRFFIEAQCVCAIEDCVLPRERTDNTD